MLEYYCRLQDKSSLEQRQIHVSENPKELLEMILSAKMPSSDTWIERLNVDFPRD